MKSIIEEKFARSRNNYEDGYIITEVGREVTISGEGLHEIYIIHVSYNESMIRDSNSNVIGYVPTSVIGVNSPVNMNRMISFEDIEKIISGR